MKRSKFEEKTTGPMFPRLHVNDTERGGPRAPPRNKMALYEQLTIPSNRYKPGNGGLSSNSGASQGTSHERVMYFPSYQSPVTRPLPSHSADRPQRHPSDAVNSRSAASQAEQKRNREDEDDFAVPIFSHPGKEQYNVARQRTNNEERCRTFSSSCTLRLPNSCNKETDQVNSDNLNLRQDREDQDKEQTTVLVSRSEPTAKYSADISARETSDEAIQLQEDVQTGDHLDMNRTSRLMSTNVDNRYSGSCGPIKEADSIIFSRLKPTSPSKSSNRKEFDCEDEGNQRGDSLSREHMDRGNNVLRASNVTTISDDVSADDIVDVIGLKHFWKARRVIVNQQRVFAVQVFELHRLVKVQQLISETPDVLIDAGAFLGKSSIRATPLRKTPSEYTAKALANFNKPQDDSEMPNHSIEMEDATENVVAKAPVASPPAPSQPLSHLSFPVNPAVGAQASTAPEPLPVLPMATTFPQAGGHQWLVPVMSPSEGLVYKPYPGPGFPSPVCGGCGPHGTTPLPGVPGHLMSPNYGVPPSHYYHQHPGAPFNVQAYFPPYGMPAMNSALSGSAVDQINQRSGSNPNGETSQKVIRRPNFSVQQQGSCNIPSQRHSELIGSTGSSPSERAQDIVRPTPTKCPTPNTKETDALTLFPPAPISGSLGKAPQPRKTNQPTTLVKVVPHNARTATESAARIFRSIQEERRRHQPN